MSHVKRNNQLTRELLLGEAITNHSKQAKQDPLGDTCTRAPRIRVSGQVVHPIKKNKKHLSIYVSIYRV